MLEEIDLCAPHQSPRLLPESAPVPYCRHCAITICQHHCVFDLEELIS